jgi:hypothetical protein
MSATVAHASSISSSASHLASGYGPKPVSASFFAKLTAAFWLAVDVMHEAHEEERKAHARAPFTAW